VSLRIGRLVLETHRQVIYLHLGPKRNCPACHGEGAIPALTETQPHDIEYDLCPCWRPAGIRIPLAPRTRRNAEVPF